MHHASCVRMYETEVVTITYSKKERKHLEDLGVDTRNLLKWSSQKHSVA